MMAVNWRLRLTLIKCLLLISSLVGSVGWQQALAQQEPSQQTSKTPRPNEPEPKADQVNSKDSSDDDELFVAPQADSSENSESKTEASKLKNGVTAAIADNSLPIVIDGVEVFRIRHSVGPYSIPTRVENIQRRLKQAKSDKQYLNLVESIRAVNQHQVAEIMIGNEPLAIVTDQDARAEGLNSRMTLAERQASNLKKALLQSIESHRPGSLILAAGQTAVSALALMLSLMFLNWLFPKIYAWIKVARGKQIKSLRIQNAELISDQTLADVLIGVLRVTRVTTVIALLGIFIPLALSFFPETRGIASDIVDWAVQPVVGVALPAILAYLPNVFVIILIAIATYYLVAFVHFLFNEVGRGTITLANFDPEWADPTFKIIRFLVIAFAFVLIFPYLPGSGSPAFQQVSIFLGVLFSLGSSGAISHLVAGVFLTYTGAFKLGDRVKISDAVGDVVEKTLLATRIRTIKQEYITIPNAMVLSSHIINYSSSLKQTGLILHTTVTIGYDAPWRDVQAALIAAAKATDNILAEPAPFVLQTSLDDFFVSYEINAFTNKPQVMAVIYSDLHQNIQDQFNQAGIEIMSPHYATLRDGNRTTIPEKYLPSDYAEPSFAVKVK